MHYKPTQTTDNDDKADNTSNNSGLDPKFKAAMDSYEAVMDEYIAFMKKFNANPNDVTLLANYASYAQKYAEAAQAFAKWEDEDLNDAEVAYYIDVQTRVNKKLLEVAG